MLTAYGGGVKKKKRKLEREGGQKSRQRGRKEGKRSLRPLPLILNTSKTSQLSHHPFTKKKVTRCEVQWYPAKLNREKLHPERE